MLSKNYVITKLILEKSANKKSAKEYRHILLLLASHGNVCNVMKEVAIGNAYGLMTGLHVHLFNCICICIHFCMMFMYIYIQINWMILCRHNHWKSRYESFERLSGIIGGRMLSFIKMTNNTHHIAGFHNYLAKDIGVVPYNDPYITTPYSSICNNWKKGLSQVFCQSLS